MSHSAEAVIPNTPQLQTTKRKCTFCGAPLDSAELFCGACGRVQSLNLDINYFDAFPPAADVEAGCRGAGARVLSP